MTGIVPRPWVGFRRDLRAEVVAGEATYLFSEHGVTAIEAESLERLVPLLDGTRDVAALMRAAAGESPDQITALIRNLADAGLLTAHRPDAGLADPAALAYWESAGLDGHDAAGAVGAASVAVTAVGETDSAAVLAACEAAGLTTVAGAADLGVVLCTDYLDAELARVDAEHRAAGRPWMLAKPVGTQLWLGPVFEPGGACWHCLVHRLWTHRRAEAYVQRTLGRRGPVPRPRATIAPAAAVAANLIALEAAKWAAGQRNAGQRSVWVLDTLTLRGEHHDLRARPQCHSCGDPELVRRQTRQPVRLQSRPKASVADGGHRALTAEEMRRRFGHLISPITGVVREIRQDDRGPAFLNAYRAGANLAVDPRGIGDLRHGLRGEHGGKGVTAVQAEVSALCEAVERCSGAYHGDELTVRASLAELGDEAVHPNALQLVHERQRAGRDEWNDRHSAFQWIGPEFDESATIDWTPVWSLTGGRSRLVPTGLLYYGSPAVEGARGLRADSNGCAAGSSLEDAVLQGFFELVERDAVALWWYNRTPLPGVDLDAFGDAWIGKLRQVHRSLHREVWALDVTADLGVPTFVALSRRIDKPAEDIVFGFGAHLDARVALRRALTELNQMLPAVAAVDAEDRGHSCNDPEARRWWRDATVAGQPYLWPAVGQDSRTPADYPGRVFADLREDLRWVERTVADHGLELMVLDQTRPDIGLPVVKVIVPGLRPMWARFAPGRLYDVPVRLGRRTEPIAFEDLNPIPVFV
ncbi:TOMM precursor leader peptide-binding protein [Dactylosporangium sp. NPDC051484]|uniref:TOMM precursor leader peptide-binding protein n=1 Tax=Dactylosporangium sp. NPDC051484 TaxID=3154942 RepID=UPI00344BE605